jgi:uncharacterized repeat protein (TIGR01451 family)
LTGVSALQINGLSYSNFSVAATQIVATIPSNATSGQIEITGPGGMFITTNVFAILPKIYGFSPNIGPVGTVVTISGTSLFDVTSVEFGGVATSDFTATTNQVQVVVPAGAASGPLTVVTPYGNDTSTNSFTATKPSLVVLTKTASPIVTAPGSEITYTLLVTNEGPSIITSASVTDSLPGNLDFISAATGAGTWSYANGIVTWQIGFLTNGDSVNLGIVSVATNVSALTNFATLTFAEGNLAAIGNSASVTNYAVSNSQRTLSIVLQANPPALQVSWPVSPANFLVQVNTNLNSPWFLPSHAAFVTNSLNIFTDSLSAPQTFFRLAPP